jgi:hypothetical protein
LFDYDDDVSRAAMSPIYVFVATRIVRHAYKYWAIGIFEHIPANGWMKHPAEPGQMSVSHDDHFCAKPMSSLDNLLRRVSDEEFAVCAQALSLQEGTRICDNLPERLFLVSGCGIFGFVFRRHGAAMAERIGCVDRTEYNDGRTAQLRLSRCQRQGTMTGGAPVDCDCDKSGHSS